MYCLYKTVTKEQTKLPADKMKKCNCCKLLQLSLTPVLFFLESRLINGSPFFMYFFLIFAFTLDSYCIFCLSSFVQSKIKNHTLECLYKYKTIFHILYKCKTNFYFITLRLQVSVVLKYRNDTVSSGFSSTYCALDFRILNLA